MLLPSGDCMGFRARGNPNRPRALKKNVKLWTSQLRRRRTGTLNEERLSETRRKALAAIARMEDTKSTPIAKSVREIPANTVLGPRFSGRRLVSSMRFDLPGGNQLRVRLLKASDGPKLWSMYYEGMSEKSRELFASFPIFVGTKTSDQMRARLQEMSVDEAPRGKKLRSINRGKAAGTFNPKYPVNREGILRGEKPILFNPSVNYVMTDPKTGRVEGFFQIKYLGQSPIFGAALRDEHHGKGLGVLGTRFRMDVARRLGLKTVRATVNPANVSKTILEREGFRVIGTEIIHKGLPDEHEEVLMEAKLE